MSQREFAKTIGVSHGLVSHIETGIKPVSERVRKSVISSLRVTDDDLTIYNEILSINQTKE